MNFCILIPTVNRKDLLVPALEYYNKNMPNTDVFVWDNGNQLIPQMNRLETVVVFKNYGVSKSWNCLINLAINRGYDNFLILNDDVIYQGGEEYINRLISNENKTRFYRCGAIYNWSVFILNKSIFNQIGPFDENFKGCYFEDNDYEYRMRIGGVDVVFDQNLNPAVYLNSQSIAKDPLLSNFIDNRDYFIKKWGGQPGEEKYKTPFNI